MVDFEAEGQTVSQKRGQLLPALADFGRGEEYEIAVDQGREAGDLVHVFLQVGPDGAYVRHCGGWDAQ